MFFRLHLTRRRMINPVLLLAMIAALAGCTYQVRTFFFTGVPEPGQEEERKVGVTVNEKRTQVQNSRAERKRQARLSRLQQKFAHGPYAADRCEACHVTSGGKLIRGEDGSISTSKRVVNQRLAYSEKELCLGCHSDKRAAAARERDLWQHGPAANKICTACHNPHASTRRFMLRKETDEQLCGQCHSADSFHRGQAHTAAVSGCTDCHNPHMGRSSLLLRTDYDERQGFGGS